MSFIPFIYSFVIGYIRLYFYLLYRQTKEGIIKARGKNLPNHPSYGHICKRVNKLNNICINNNRCNIDDDDLIIAIDSASIKMTNRGHWRIDKWGIQKKNKKKGYPKILVTVNVKTNKEILALEITDDEKIHYGKQMKALVEYLFKRTNNNRSLA